MNLKWATDRTCDAKKKNIFSARKGGKVYSRRTTGLRRLFRDLRLWIFGGRGAIPSGEPGAGRGP